VKLNYTYLKAGTNTPVAVAGYHNFNDIDMGQSVRVYSDMNIKQIYCTPNNVLHYKEGADYLEIGEVNGTSITDNNDQSVWINYTYDETSSFTILFGAEGAATFVYTYEALMPITKPVTVRYTDASGKELAPPDTLSGEIGQSYEIKPKTIKGYVLEKTPDNAKGTFSDTEQTVSFVYKVAPTPTPTATPIPVQEGSVKVLHLDKDNKKLAESETLKGAIGTEYTAKPKEIKGYTLTKEPENATGTYTSKEQTVTFIYTESIGSVVVKYVDGSGKKLADNSILSGKLGEAYETKAKSITGYTLTETPKNSKGTFKKDAQEVVYKYKKTTSAKTTSITRKAAPKTGDSSGDMLLFYGALSIVAMTVVMISFKKRIK
jgi:uncharacterized surface anchored protein